jgi:H+-transporting ATPase
MSNVEKEPGPQGNTTPPSEPEQQQPVKRKREYKDFGEDEEKPTRMFFSFVTRLPMTRR